MLKNANGGDGSNNKDSQQLIKLIKDTGFEQFYELGAREGLICQQPVIVKTVAADGGSATIAFPSDPTYETKIYFTNCTNTKLISGQKVYLHHNFDNPSQGWLSSNQNNYKVGTLIPQSGVSFSIAGYSVRQIGSQVIISATASFSTAVSGTSFNVPVFSLSGVDYPPTGANLRFPVAIYSTSATGYLYRGPSNVFYITGAQNSSTTWYVAILNFSYFI